MKELQRIKALEQQGEIVAALSQALAYWRRCRSAVVAEAIDALSEKALLGFDPPPMPRKNVDFHRKWLEQLALQDPIAVGWLAQMLPDKLPGKSHEKSDALLERFAAIEKIAPDSRMAVAITKLFDEFPKVAHSFVAIETGARLLAQFGDERAKSATVHISARGKLEQVQQSLGFEALAEDEVAGWKALCGAEATTSTTASGDQLLQGVLQDPAAEEPRAVFADWLMERDDPRGEFIALQLREERGDASDAAIARAAKLLSENAKQWLGDLLQVVQRAWFRRGFLWKIEIVRSNVDPSAWETLVADPNLATVEELDGHNSHAMRVGQFVTSPAMRSLRSLDLYDDYLLEAVKQRPPTQVQLVRCATWKRRPYLERFTEVLSLLESETSFPALTTLRCDLSALDAVTQSPLVERLRALHLEGDPQTILARFEELPVQVQALRCCHKDEYLELRRVAGGTVVTAEGEKCAIALGEALPILPLDTTQIDVLLPRHPDQYLKKPRGLDLEAMKQAATQRGLPLTLRKQPRRSGKVAGLH